VSAMSSLEKPDFVVVHIGARGKLSRREAKHAAALWKRLQREAPQAHFKVAIAGYDEDPRALWEIPEAAAYVRMWARMAGLTDPERQSKRSGRGTIIHVERLSDCSIYAASLATSRFSHNPKRRIDLREGAKHGCLFPLNDDVAVFQLRLNYKVGVFQPLLRLNGRIC